MKPYYEDKYVTIYHADCREILPQLPKVDLVLTDPPYGISSVHWDTAIDVKEFWQLLNGYRAIVFSCQPLSNPDHPTQKPIPLVEWLIQTYSNPSDLILDPFLGSGTTAYCAKKLNRKCIGIEIEEKYCEIAARRCSQEVMDLQVARATGGRNE